MRKGRKIGHVLAIVGALAALVASASGDGASGLGQGIGYLGPEEVRAEIERRELDMARARESITEIEDRIAALRPQIDDGELEHAARIAEARKLVILHDRIARGGWLRAAMSSTSLTDIAVLGRVTSTLIERETETLGKLSYERKEIEDRIAALEADVEALRKLESDLEQHRKDLESLLATGSYAPSI